MSTDDNIKYMVWRPKLVKLTQMSYFNISAGGGTGCFVDPSEIVVIQRGLVGQAGEALQEYTLLRMRTGHEVAVIETPEVVNRLIEEAYSGRTPASATVRPIR